MKTGFAIFCVVLIGGGAGLTIPLGGLEQSGTQADAQAVQAASASLALASTPATSQWAQEVSLPKEADGHYYAQVNIDGLQTRMLVDTGASVIALTGEDAAALGLYWDDSDLAPIARGASGPIMGVNVILPRVAVGAFEADNVGAIIVPEGLHISLLGQSFLSTVDKVQIAGDRMVLGTSNMSKWSLLPRRWRTRKEAAAHADAIADILDTPPIVPAKDGVVLFSMIGTAVLLPYLVAVKSLWQQLGRGRVALLDDGTLTGEDRAILAHHCGDPEILSIADVKLDGFPAGGCWERFLTILDRRGSEYWIQLDSDTVTLGPVAEVAKAIDTNCSFTLLGGEDAGEEAELLSEFAKRRYPDGPQEGHIQAQVESRMGQIDKPDWRYIRGCAGFAGFAAGGPGRKLAVAFLAQMADLAGEDAMDIWGTEQIASNFQIANEPRSIMLPYARYLNYWAQGWGKEAAFVHFVGTHRYDNGDYARASRVAIDKLLS